MTAQDSDRAFSGQWQALGAVSPVHLREAGCYLRYALQWVERGARCCLGMEFDRVDGGHSACVIWDSELSGMFSPPLGEGKTGDSKRLGLRFFDGVPCLLFGEDDPFVLDDRTDSEARQWVRERVESLSFSATSFNDPVLLPAHPLADGGRYKLSEHRASFSELSLWFGNAGLLLERLRMGKEMVCCSSVGFDLSLRHGRQGEQRGNGNGKTSKREVDIGGRSGSGIVGFCGGDLLYPQPYFYVVSDPAWDNEPEWLGDGARGVGMFHRQDFSGFVLLGEQVVPLAEQESMVGLFLREAMEIPAIEG